MNAGIGVNPSEAEGVHQHPFHRIVTQIIRLIAFSGKVIAVATIVFMFFALLANVVLRYAFGSGISWAYEIHALLLPWLVGAGVVIAAARGTNIAITILPDMLAPELRRGLLVVIEVVLVIICVTVLQSSKPILMASKFQTLSTLGIKQYWGYLSLVYAFAGMACISVLEVVRLLTGASVANSDAERRSLS
ncbi:TRAP transporter small permease subunit [Donghicola sp. C2-DW-16]|uniref:TRAP transporter small permease protein n=1 Tax=Donghicola mangrovi TaxID=2729614 RepID=A0A850Q997_9RHOB|nr:TRAP transporter small permease subunit [Donghicola mangrovi]NVO23350.1 TRAP transporter small permease subunit [Donghicola mangrovi]NVO27192.1 TRAP transporter small permease subunit [Donghicola mangrovi]